MSDRCPRAITFGAYATRCYLAAGHTGSHSAHTHVKPWRILEWGRDDPQAFDTDRDDIYAWRGKAMAP